MQYYAEGVHVRRDGQWFSPDLLRRCVVERQSGPGYPCKFCLAGLFRVEHLCDSEIEQANLSAVCDENVRGL
jgi:hypothetical protein